MKMYFVESVSDGFCFLTQLAHRMTPRSAILSIAILRVTLLEKTILVFIEFENQNESVIIVNIQPVILTFTSQRSNMI